MIQQNKSNNFDQIPKVFQQNIKKYIMKNTFQRNLFNKAFLEPFEIALKTWKTEENKKLNSDDLAIGLKLVVKQDISDNKYVLQDFKSIQDLQKNDKYSHIRKNNLNNILSLLKPTEAQRLVGIDRQKKPVKVCICICTYVQDKTAYRKTIGSVLKNIQKFIDNSVSPDQILVVIVQDGIEKVHDTVTEFFTQLQKQSFIFLDKQTEHLPFDRLLNIKFQTLEQDEIININELIFDQQQLKMRKKKRFASRKEQYVNAIKNISKIQKYQKQKALHISDFDSFFLNIFYKAGRQYLMEDQNVLYDFLKKEKRIAQKQLKQLDHSTLARMKKQIKDKQIEQYFKVNTDNQRVVINKTLIAAKSQCQKYIQSRNDLALVNCFRVDFRQESFIGAQNMMDQDQDNYKGFRKNMPKYDESEINKMNDEQLRQYIQEHQKYKMNLIFITKYKNSGKLSSHNWFFNGLCKEVKCQYAVLLDVGLIPGKQSIFKMIKHMDRHPKCGGVCGYMNLNLQKADTDELKYRENIDWVSDIFHNYLADIQKVQQVQYHFAHLIDKSFQSLFKFIHVLPGAYSAYRMDALMPHKQTQIKFYKQKLRQKIKKIAEDYQLDQQQLKFNSDDRLMKQYFKSIQQDYLTRMKFVEPQQQKTFNIILKIILPDFAYYWCFRRPDQISEKGLRKIKANKELLAKKMAWDEKNNVIEQLKKFKLQQENKKQSQIIHQNMTEQRQKKNQQKQQMTYQQLLYNKNVYFAQDRTLCLGIYQNEYTLEYLPDAVAWVDPVKDLHGLLGQRKRWINGSFFAFEHVKTAMLYRSTGSIFLKLQILYLSLMNILSFVSPAFFFFTVHTTMYTFRDWFFTVLVDGNLAQSNFQKNQLYNAFVYAIDFLYIMLMFGLILKSMHFTHRDPNFYPYVYTMSTIYGVFSLAVFIFFFIDLVVGLQQTITCLIYEKQKPFADCSVTFLLQEAELRQRFFKVLPGGVMIYFIYKWVILAVFCLYFIPISIYCLLFSKIQFLIQIIIGTFSFIFYTPTYLNIMPTFALCRIDDISWGTKGLDAAGTADDEISKKWKSIKLLHVVKFVFWNVVVGIVLIILSSDINLRINQIDAFNVSQQELKRKTEYENNQKIQRYVRVFYTTLFLVAVMFLTLFLKVSLGALYSIIYRCSQCCQKENENKEPKAQNRQVVNMYFNKMKPSMYKNLNKYIKRKIKFYKQQNMNSLLAFAMRLNQPEANHKIKLKNQLSYKQIQQESIMDSRDILPDDISHSILQMMVGGKQRKSNQNLFSSKRGDNQTIPTRKHELPPINNQMSKQQLRNDPFGTEFRQQNSSFQQLNSKNQNFSLGSFLHSGSKK